MKIDQQKKKNVARPQAPKASNGKPRAPRQQMARTKGVSAPTSVAFDQIMTNPSVKNNGSNKVVVRHREFIKDLIVGTVGFAAETFCVNPGCKATFPWLARMALGYEQYTFRKLAFDFVSRLSTSTSGSVAISTDYDAGDQPPSSMTEALNRQNTVESAVWRTIRSVLSPQSMNAFKQHFVRDQAVPGDIKTYDVANVTYCTDGLQAAGNLGKIFVEYEVELSSPIYEAVVPKCTTQSLLPFTLLTTDLVANSVVYADVTPYDQDPDDIVNFICNPLKLTANVDYQINSKFVLSVHLPKGAYRVDINHTPKLVAPAGGSNLVVKQGLDIGVTKPTGSGPWSSANMEGPSLWEVCTWSIGNNTLTDTISGFTVINCPSEDGNDVWFQPYALQIGTQSGTTRVSGTPDTYASTISFTIV